MVSLRQRLRSIALVERLGPGLVTGAADDDPSGIATYSQAGARFGFDLLWTLVLTFPLMSAIQLVGAHIGRVTGNGLAKNMGEVMPRFLVLGLIALVFIANTINIGADLAAMGAVGKLTLGGNAHIYTLLFASVSLLLQLFIPYHRYVRFLKWLTLSLFAYVAVVLSVHLDWSAALLGIVWPRADLSPAAITTVVAVFGTTISPYLFFWQTAQEVEETAADNAAHPLRDAPGEAKREFARMRWDTIVGMAFSNLIALAIMASAAATLHAGGKTEIQTAADAAEALRPIAGNFAFALFSIGIIGTGLLAVPVLAGSVGYAVGESQGWKCGLEYMPWEAIGFYTVIGVSVVIGLAIDWSPLNPIAALFWSAVINGVVAVPLMAAMMFVASHKEQMGNYTVRGGLWWLGWGATLVMAAASIAMLVMM